MDTKKVITVVIGIVVAIIIAVTSYLIFRPEKETYEFNDDKPLVNPNKEAITGAFIDIKYERSTESDTEYITFNSDGSFSYYCACGNAVDNYDLCEYYTYDGKETINLVCFDEDGIINTIKVAEATDELLVLDFAGNLREFNKVVETE